MKMVALMIALVFVYARILLGVSKLRRSNPSRLSDTRKKCETQERFMDLWCTKVRDEGIL